MREEYCIESVVGQVHKKLGYNDVTRAEVVEIIESLVGISETGTEKGMAERALKQAEKMLIQNKFEEFNTTFRAKLMNLRARKEVEANLNRVVKNNEGITKTEAYSAKMVGTAKPFKGGGMSTDYRIKAIDREFKGGLAHDLERSGLYKIAMSDDKNMQRAITRELFAIGRKDTPSEGVTGIPEAKQIADIFHKYQEAARNRQNAAGAYIKKLDGYIVRNSHDMNRVRNGSYGKQLMSTFNKAKRSELRAAAKQEWIDYVKTKLDEEVTFKDVKLEDRDEWLGLIYDNLSQGEHLKPGVDSDVPIRIGGRNIAKNTSASRKLHWKDGDAWFDYNEKYGSRDLSSSLVLGLERAAQNIGLMEDWGPAPYDTFEKVLLKLKEEARTNPDVVGKVDGRHEDKLRRQFDALTGANNIPTDNMIAKVGSALRGLQTISKLGSVLFASFNDLVAMSSELRYQGTNLLDGYGKSVTGIFKGRRGGFDKELALDIGVGLDTANGMIVSRFTSIDNPNGMLSNGIEKFMKIAGISWWTDTLKTTAAIEMASKLGKQADIVFDKLGDGTKRILEMYNIDKNKWDVIRKYAVKADDGRTFIVPESVRNVSDSEIESLMFKDIEMAHRGITKDTTPEVKARKIAEYRQRMETELRTYFMDRVDYAVPTPGAKQEAIVKRTGDRGTIIGELKANFWQFKSFPLTLMQKVYGREFNGYSATGGASVTGIAHLIVGMTIMGYISMTAKDVAKGKKPKVFTDDIEQNWKILEAAMLQGGGLGLYGDFLFGTESRYGHSALEALAGPVNSLFLDAGNVYADARGGKDVTTSLVYMAKNNIPMVNLWYTKAALDYFIWYNLQERMNPGSLKRMERKMKREYGQEYFIPPSSIY